MFEALARALIHIYPPFRERQGDPRLPARQGPEPLGHQRQVGEQEPLQEGRPGRQALHVQDPGRQGVLQLRLRSPVLRRRHGRGRRLRHGLRQGIRTTLSMSSSVTLPVFSREWRKTGFAPKVYS